ncbi:Protein translocase subunit SecA [Candidatus Kinetoplastibacterium sorsogonicusi]|uniref:Protein translocase subunit SecA n=1 Tax=Candidatus Kinetoplastidibacterium kentomonadis TaxID=1576550 RepID=A0A3S7JAF4_9PROT|nr:preprotein translocase subunit SecA [Candidatus Kinetoplastibacterium sorsogonicusi]AWD32653.1 Protein translocase subunit SecA [Candidatus Kinetoplastibacterium sorsogonicusi]
MILSSFFKKVFVSRNQKLLNKYQKILSNINFLEISISALSNNELKEKTIYLKNRYIAGESLDELLPEAFAIVREVSKRVLNMRHFDVQIIGGIALHFCKIAEMRTGEGKTLVATLPVYLNALAGKGVHVITVNDYLARRDAEWMSKIYNFLGMSVGTIVSQQSDYEKKLAYQADITYGTNNEFGFDYLRDNMEISIDNKRQRGLFYAIVDEVDSILIDESRTPLIISGQAENNTDIYNLIDKISHFLKKMPYEPKKNAVEPQGDFWIDEKNNQVYLSESGQEVAEKMLIKFNLLSKEESLYDPKNLSLMHHLINSLRAYNLFFKNQHYVVKNNEVIIVDEFTGRLMHGRRWSDGLHQAIEAKEKVSIKSDNKTLASITFQNYFRIYEKLSGMTGTADTEAYEFQEIYNLETVIIPTNKNMIRKDENDKVFRTKEEKFHAIISDIKSCYEKGQPVLVGTTNIENSEFLSNKLKLENLPHNILNAKQHLREANIIAEAGKIKCITIATNMAGRGTDIVLGGNIDKYINHIKNDSILNESEKSQALNKLYLEHELESKKVKNLGGLRVIGTERHDSRRIDNQLRGRSGRQGDPGSSIFYLSLEDPLMKIFSGDKISSIMEKLKLPKYEAIEAKMVNKAIESAQRRVERFNFDIRKHLLEYDDIDNEQRRTLYKQRDEIINASPEEIRIIIDNIIKDVVTNLYHEYIIPNSYRENWNLQDLEKTMYIELGIKLDIQDIINTNPHISEEKLLQFIIFEINNYYKNKISKSWVEIEKITFLETIDLFWRDHLSDLEYLRQGIHLRGYAQKNPIQEYKKDAFYLFSNMLNNIYQKLVKNLMKLSYEYFNNQINSNININDSINRIINTEKNENLQLGRNEKCYCKSGKKYKFCHGSGN